MKNEPVTGSQTVSCFFECKRTFSLISRNYLKIDEENMEIKEFFY